MSSIIKFKRGTEAAIQTHVLYEGEPAVSLDSYKLYVGDGTTAGGFRIGITDLTTKGDFLGHDGSNAGRIAIGTDGYALIADATAEFGVSWQVIPGSLWETDGNSDIQPTA